MAAVLKDVFDAPVSTRNSASLETFNEAATLSLGYRPGGTALLQAALADDPDFIMARCLLAGGLLVASDKKYQDDLRVHATILKSQYSQANERERGHIDAMWHWLGGDFYAASQTYANVLANHPRDLCALQIGHQIDFTLGQANSTRDRPARILNSWSEDDPAYSYVLGMLAFGLEESGHFEVAEEKARKCLELNPKDVWGLHALAHCFEMQGKIFDGISYMEDHESNWMQDDNFMRIHNRWHLSLFYIEQCKFQETLNMHDKHMKISDDSELMDMHDSAALIWRLHLNGFDVGNRFDILSKKYTNFIEQAYLSFTDIHSAMAFAGAGNIKAGNELIKVLEGHTEGTSTSSLMTRMAGLDLVKGILAFGREDYAACVELLSRARYNSHVIGGSIAQRDVINMTLLEAGVRSKNVELVDGLIAERTLMKPQFSLTATMAARVRNA